MSFDKFEILFGKSGTSVIREKDYLNYCPREFSHRYSERFVALPAFKVTPNEGRIQINIVAGKKKILPLISRETPIPVVEISVKDNGPGICSLS